MSRITETVSGLNITESKTSPRAPIWVSAVTAITGVFEKRSKDFIFSANSSPLQSGIHKSVKIIEGVKVSSSFRAFYAELHKTHSTPSFLKSDDITLRFISMSSTIRTDKSERIEPKGKSSRIFLTSSASAVSTL